MICFEVRLNGELVHRAGAEDIKVLTTMLTWANRNKEEDGFPLLRSSGMNKAMQHVNWGSHERLQFGDEISIRIIETDEADEPKIVDSLSNEITAEISNMLEKIKSLNPFSDGF